MSRQYLTPRERIVMLQEQGGKCAMCGCAEEPFEADHSTPVTWKGGKPDWLLCVPCHRAKTQKDIKAIAKVRRLRGETKQRKWSRPFPKGRKLQSRPFNREKRA